jgi:hypothetical protein
MICGAGRISWRLARDLARRPAPPDIAYGQAGPPSDERAQRRCSADRFPATRLGHAKFFCRRRKLSGCATCCSATGRLAPNNEFSGATAVQPRCFAWQFEYFNDAGDGPGYSQGPRTHLNQWLVIRWRPRKATQYLGRWRTAANHDRMGSWRMRPTISTSACSAHKNGRRLAWSHRPPKGPMKKLTSGSPASGRRRT